MRRVLFSLPDSSIEWLQANADALGISRDAFLRQLVAGARESWEALKQPGTDERLFLERLEDRLLAQAQTATTEAVSKALRAFGGVPPKGKA